jgi:hypothetical protein
MIETIVAITWAEAHLIVGMMWTIATIFASVIFVFFLYVSITEEPVFIIPTFFLGFLVFIGVIMALNGFGIIS